MILMTIIIMMMIMVTMTMLMVEETYLNLLSNYQPVIEVIQPVYGVPCSDNLKIGLFQLSVLCLRCLSVSDGNIFY